MLWRELGVSSVVPRDESKLDPDIRASGQGKSRGTSSHRGHLNRTASVTPDFLPITERTCIFLPLI